ncbi:MAG: GNAT family N-acetyltransferase [Bacteroidota bacterium]
MDVTKRSSYTSFIQEVDAPIFHQPWWLDVVCGVDGWDYVSEVNGDRTIAVWPYHQKSKGGISYITIPALTPYLGPWYRVPDSLTKQTSIVGFHQQLQQKLISKLPSVSLAHYQWHTSHKEYMSMYWAGYQQTSRFTLHIDLRQPKEALWAALKDRQRNKIRNAQASSEATLDGSIEAFWSANQETFRRQEMEVPYAKAMFMQLDKELARRDQRRIIMVIEDNQVSGGIYLIHDNSTAYLLATGRHQSSHAVAFAIWTGILWAKEQGLHTFDFEGSMMKGISTFFQSFGGRRVSYPRFSIAENIFWDRLYKLIGKL